MFSVVALASLAAAPAHAGHWVITVSGGGTTPYYPNGTDPDPHCTFEDSQLTYPLPPNYFNIWLSDSDDLGRADVNTHITGEVTLSIGATLTWTPSYPGDTSLPPLSVDVLETGRAGVDTNVNPPPGVADDGLGDSIVYTSGSVTSQGSHLYHLAVPMGQTSVTLPGRLLSASRPDVPGGDPMMNTYVNYSVVQDTRAVTISADVDATLGKGPRYDENGVVMYNIYGDQMFTPHPHTRMPDGTMYGDIGIADSTDGIYNHVTIDYDAERVGTWSIDGDIDSWYHTLLHSNFDPDHQGDTITSYSPNISTFSVQYNGWASNPSTDPSNINERSTIGTDHVFFSYTDGHDKAKATANYYMAVHRPYEYILSKKPAEADWRQVPITVDPNQSFGNDASCSFTYNADNPMVAEVTFDGPGKTATEGVLTVAGAATPLPWLNALLTAGAFGLDKFGPVPAHGTAIFDNCFESNYSTFSPARPADYFTLSLDDQRKERALYKIQPYFFVRYTKKYYTVDTWDWKGYAGQQYRMLETLDQSADGSPASTQPLGAFTKDSYPAPADVPHFPGS